MIWSKASSPLLYGTLHYITASNLLKDIILSCDRYESTHTPILIMWRLTACKNLVVDVGRSGCSSIKQKGSLFPPFHSLSQNPSHCRIVPSARRLLTLKRYLLLIIVASIGNPSCFLIPQWSFVHVDGFLVPKRMVKFLLRNFLNFLFFVFCFFFTVFVCGLVPKVCLVSERVLENMGTRKGSVRILSVSAVYLFCLSDAHFLKS